MSLLSETKKSEPTFSFQSCEHKDEIVVEVRELVQLLKFLTMGLRVIQDYIMSISQQRINSLIQLFSGTSFSYIIPADSTTDAS